MARLTAPVTSGGSVGFPWVLLHEDSVRLGSLLGFYIHNLQPPVHETWHRDGMGTTEPGHPPPAFRDPGFRFSLRCDHPYHAKRSGDEVAPRRVLGLLWEKPIRHRLDIMPEFYHTFWHNTIVTNSARWVFGSHVLLLLARGQPVHLFPYGSQLSRRSSTPGEQILSDTSHPSQLPDHTKSKPS